MNLDNKPCKDERLGQLLGGSSGMQYIFKQIKKAATVDISILLQGETGTGKDLAAQAIHHMSTHHEGPYVPLNLSALPSEMVASELFGHEKGAFTGAIAQHKGKFEQARHGTVFLDEIESIDEDVQVSLLRLIEGKKFYRLGGKRQISTNARLTVASNENLEQLIQQGTFRKDLFYRLDVFPIYMPPLRKHREDIPLLITQFVARYNRLLKKQITRIAEDCLDILQSYEWPGNVRELKNVIQRAVLLCNGEELRTDHLPTRLRAERSTVSMLHFHIGTSLEEIERTVIIRTLEMINNNRTEAAKCLGISRRALYNRLRKHGIE